MIKLSDESIVKVKEFLKKHPNPMLRGTTTLIAGHVACIGPVPTICGPELHCNHKVMPALEHLLRGVE